MPGQIELRPLLCFERGGGGTRGRCAAGTERMLRPYQLERNEEGKAFPYSNAVAERPAQRGRFALP